MDSVLERAARVIPVHVVTHLFPESALVPPSPLPAPAGTSAAAPSPAPSATPSASEIFVQAVGSHLRGLITEPDIKAEIAAVISECGFEAGALDRLSAMEVEPHLNEVTEVGRSIRHRLFGFNDEGLRARVQYSISAPSEQIELMLDVATVFLMAAIGDGSSHPAASGSASPTLDEVLLSLGAFPPDSGARGTPTAKESLTPSAPPRNLGSTSRSISAPPVAPSHADVSSEGSDSSIPVLGAEVPEFMRWAPPDEQPTRASASGVKLRWVVAPLALGAMGYLVGTSESVQTWVRFMLAEPEQSMAESEISPRARRRLARLNTQNEVAGPPATDEPGAAPLAAQPSAPEAVQPPETLLMASDSSLESGRAKLSLEGLEPALVPQAGDMAQVDTASPRPAMPATQQSLPASPSSDSSSEQSLIKELSSLLSGGERIRPENSSWALSDISFEPGRKEPAGVSDELFKQIAWLLEAHPRARIEISVPTTIRGAESAASMALTQVRAEQLKNKLLSGGVSKTRIDTRARSDSDLSGDVPSEFEGLVSLRLLRR